MEIVLAFLLLFGGFTLGSVTADKGGDISQSTGSLSARDDAEGSSPIIQTMHQVDPTPCHSDRGQIIKDLTKPYRGKEGLPTTGPASDGDCPDE